MSTIGPTIGPSLMNSFGVGGASPGAGVDLSGVTRVYEFDSRTSWGTAMPGQAAIDVYGDDKWRLTSSGGTIFDAAGKLTPSPATGDGAADVPGTLSHNEVLVMASQNSPTTTKFDEVGCGADDSAFGQSFWFYPDNSPAANQRYQLFMCGAEDQTEGIRVAMNGSSHSTNPLEINLIVRDRTNAVWKGGNTGLTITVGAWNWIGWSWSPADGELMVKVNGDPAVTFELLAGPEATAGTYSGPYWGLYPIQLSGAAWANFYNGRYDQIVLAKARPSFPTQHALNEATMDYIYNSGSGLHSTSW